MFGLLGLSFRRKGSNSNGAQTSGKPEDSSAETTSENMHKLALSDKPIFQYTEREKKWQSLEIVRVHYNTRSLSFEPVEVGPLYYYISESMSCFAVYAKIAAEHGSRVARIRFSETNLNKLKIHLSKQEGRDEACAIIRREYGIESDRITFGMATRITHGSAPQHLLWMDIDFG